MAEIKLSIKLSPLDAYHLHSYLMDALAALPIETVADMMVHSQALELRRTFNTLGCEYVMPNEPRTRQVSIGQALALLTIPWPERAYADHTLRTLAAQLDNALVQKYQPYARARARNANLNRFLK